VRASCRFCTDGTRPEPGYIKYKFLAFLSDINFYDQQGILGMVNSAIDRYANKLHSSSSSFQGDCLYELNRKFNSGHTEEEKEIARVYRKENITIIFFK